MIKTSNLNQAPIQYMLARTGDVAGMVMPSLRPHGITYFNFYKEYFDGTSIRLSSHQQWAEHYFEKNYITQTTNMPLSYFKKEINYAIWNPNDWLNDVLSDAATNFNIGNGISLIKVNDDSIESYGFGAETNNYSIINHFYINNLDWLERFCHYFKDMADGLIKSCESNKIIIPLYREKIVLLTNNKLSTEPLINLPKQQLKCSQLLLEGLGSKEIASHLKLSPRTIEYYINILKDKLRCKNKTELIIKLSTALNYRH